MTTNELQLIETFGNKVDNYIQIIASKSNMATDHFWPIFIKQQYLEGWGILGTGVFFILLGLFLCLLFRKQPFFTDYSAEADCPTKRFFTTIIGLIVLFVTFIVLAIKSLDIISKLYNPEYAAIKEILWMIKH